MRKRSGWTSLLYFKCPIHLFSSIVHQHLFVYFVHLLHIHWLQLLYLQCTRSVVLYKFQVHARFCHSCILPYCSSVSAHFLCHYTFCKCQKLSLCKSFSIKLLFSSTLINQIVLKSGQMFIWQNEAPTIQSAAVVNQAVIHCCEHINIKVF